jgi:hypothetical protein
VRHDGAPSAAGARPSFRAEESLVMPDLKKKFSRSDWKDCCGKGCKKCEIAQTYIGVYGKAKGLEKLNEDRAEMRTKGKSHKLKGHKKKDGKKA